MEGPMVNRTSGVLVLSRNAGADALLGRHALSVNPFDVAETVDAMKTALEMPDQERTRRASGLRRVIGGNPPEKWVNSQLTELEHSAATRNPK
jgi:trehalose 6-phosphate synthase